MSRLTRINIGNENEIEMRMKINGIDGAETMTGVKIRRVCLDGIVRSGMVGRMRVMGMIRMLRLSCRRGLTRGGGGGVVTIGRGILWRISWRAF
jgi:hypothetical protein